MTTKTEYPFLKDFKKGDYIRVKNKNFRVEIDKKSKKKTLVPIANTPRWQLNKTTYYDKDGPYHFKDGVKTRGIKAGSNAFNIDKSNKNLTTSYDRYEVLRSQDQFKNYKTGKIRGFGDGQSFSEFTAEVERGQYDIKKLKEIYSKTFNLSGSLKGRPLNKTTLDRAINARRLLEKQGYGITFKDDNNANLTWIESDEVARLSEKDAESEETLLSKYPYLSAKDLYIPREEKSPGLWTESRARTKNELNTLNKELMIQGVSDYTKTDDGSYKSGNFEGKDSLSIIKGYTTTADASYEGMVQSQDKTQQAVDLTMKERQRLNTGSRLSPLPGDKVWEQNYGKRWALMTKHERKAAKRDLRINAGE